MVGVGNSALGCRLRVAKIIISVIAKLETKLGNGLRVVGKGSWKDQEVGKI